MKSSKEMFIEIVGAEMYTAYTAGIKESCIVRTEVEDEQCYSRLSTSIDVEHILSILDIYN